MLKTNIKKILLGIGVATFALGASAYTSESELVLANHFYGFDEATQTYLEINGTPDEGSNCQNDSPQECVVGTDNPIPDGFTADDVQNTPAVRDAILYKSDTEGTYFR